MNEVVIRSMQETDLVQVCEIEKRNFSLPWSEKSFSDSMKREDTVFLVAVDQSVIAGYVGCYCIDCVGEITNVAVKDAYRRKGIARALLTALYEKSCMMDTKEFFLEVRESNMAAIALYESQGFVREGIRKNFYEQPTEHAVIMWKR